MTYPKRHPSQFQPKRSLRQRFQLRVAKVLPGLKTRITTALGAIGSGSAVLLEYVKGAPLDQLISAKQLAVLGFVLFSLAYWFRSLSNNEPIS